MTWLLFSITKISDHSFQAENLKNGIGNSFSSRKYFTAENHISQPEPYHRLLGKAHIIRKRNTNQSFKSKRRRRKGRKRRKGKRYQDDTIGRQQTTYRTSRDDRQNSASSSSTPRDDFRSVSYQQTYAPGDDNIRYADSRPPRVKSTRPSRDGILKATEVTAKNINAISMTADYVVADAIFATRIIGDVITVTSKRTRGPSMSEFIYNGKTNNLNRERWTGNEQSRYRTSKNTYESPSSFFNLDKHRNYMDYYRSYNGKVRNGKLNMENHRNHMDSLWSYKRKVRKKKYAANTYTNLHNRGPADYRGNYRIHRQLPPPRYDKDHVIIDTSNHPFISFQNGYVKRERIRKPNIGLPVKSWITYKQLRRGKQRRRTNHPSYWR